VAASLVGGVAYENIARPIAQITNHLT
jgi:hypothetical protein